MTHLFKRPGLRLRGNTGPGTYTVKSEAKIGTTLLDTSTTTFTVAEPTYAPLNATTIVLAPGRWASFS